MTTEYFSPTTFTPTTMAALMAEPESKIVYVWAPYSVFLLIVFIVLGASFFRRSRKVLKKRRVILDYIEADVTSKRPRIVRMFTSSVNRGLPYDRRGFTPRSSFRQFSPRDSHDSGHDELRPRRFPGFSRSGSINDYSPRNSMRSPAPKSSVYDHEDHGVSMSELYARSEHRVPISQQFANSKNSQTVLKWAPHGSRGHPGETSGRYDMPHPDSHRYLQVPDIQVGRAFGLEDSGHAASFRNGCLHGHSNFAFSFDEDLGRSHLRRVVAPVSSDGSGASHLHGSVQRGFEELAAKRSRLSQMDAYDLETQNPLVNPLSARNSPQPVRRKRVKHSAQVHSKGNSRVSENTLAQRMKYDERDGQRQLLCAHCGHSMYEIQQTDSPETSALDRETSVKSGTGSRSNKRKGVGGEITSNDQGASQSSSIDNSSGTEKKKHGVTFEGTKPGPKPRRSIQSMVSRITESEPSAPKPTPPEANSLKSKREKFSASSRTKSDSQSTVTSVITSDSSQSATTNTSTTRRRAGGGRSGPNLDQMFAALEVYTIPISSATDELAGTTDMSSTTDVYRTNFLSSAIDRSTNAGSSSLAGLYRLINTGTTNLAEAEAPTNAGVSSSAAADRSANTGVSSSYRLDRSTDGGAGLDRSTKTGASNSGNVSQRRETTASPPSRTQSAFLPLLPLPRGPISTTVVTTTTTTTTTNTLSVPASAVSSGNGNNSIFWLNAGGDLQQTLV